MENKTKEIRSEIVIQANPEKVWSILMDFERYPSWNPFIKKITGQAIVGKKIVARIEPPGASGMTFKPTVLVVKPFEEFRWLGNFIFTGLFDGEHIFELYENTDGSTTLIQREEFKGILVPVFAKMIDNNTRLGFELMNKKLKELCES